MAQFPDTFTETGFLAPRAPTAPITRFQVMGERSSGTNYVNRILGRNSDLKSTDILGWKHGFPMAVGLPPDLAVICVVRDARDWALSMHRKPWHTGPNMQKLPFHRFISSPWDTYVDQDKYFRGAARQGFLGQPLQLDRHPITGRRFENIFALRHAKLVGMLSYLNRKCTCILLRAETVQAFPQESLDAILEALELPERSEPFKGVTKRLGSKFNMAVEERPKTPERMSKAGLDFLRKNLDLKLEAQLGYTYD